MMRLLRFGGLALVTASCVVLALQSPHLQAQQAKCDADAQWLSMTGDPPDQNPNSPNDDCPFYQAAWQHFLVATHPSGNGDPAFFAYKNINQLFARAVAPLFRDTAQNRFLTLVPRVAERGHEGPVPGQRFVGSPVAGSDIFQAGVRGLLIDQKGHPIFFGLHVNQAFDDFLTKNQLKTVPGLLFAKPDLRFEAHSVELKSAWQIVADANPPKNYITAKALVPILTVANGQVVPSKDKTRTVTVALLSLHVVFVLDGHPEFVWSTFEHVNSAGIPDLAPPAKANPPQTDATTIINASDFTLYKKNTSAKNANTPLLTEGGGQPVPFDEATQTFKTSAGAVQQTSVYRAYPGSQKDVPGVDDEVEVLNDNVGKLFTAADLRRNYRLVGAVWLQKPEESFKVNTRFDDAALQGENRLSGVALESFTQEQNCFFCHSTRDVRNDLTSSPIIAAKLINVSHVLSKFLASQPPTFSDVKAILEHAVDIWTQAHGTPDLAVHGDTFKWNTKQELLKAFAFGHQLIQPEVIGNGRGAEANLIIDLRKGMPQRMPRGGPFLDDAAIQRIQDWIDLGCPD